MSILSKYGLHSLIEDLISLRPITAHVQELQEGGRGEGAQGGGREGGRGREGEK